METPNVMTFEFDGQRYQVTTDAMTWAGDVVELPDGRFLEIECLESFPPQVANITVVNGPTDVTNPFGPGKHIGQSWKAYPAPLFLRGTEVSLYLPPELQKGLAPRRIKCEVLEGDAGREGQVYRANRYTLKALEEDSERGIEVEHIFNDVQYGQMNRT